MLGPWQRRCTARPGTRPTASLGSRLAASTPCKISASAPACPARDASSGSVTVTQHAMPAACSVSSSTGSRQPNAIASSTSHSSIAVTQPELHHQSSQANNVTAAAAGDLSEISTYGIQLNRTQRCDYLNEASTPLITLYRPWADRNTSQRQSSFKGSLGNASSTVKDAELRDAH